MKLKRYICHYQDWRTQSVDCFFVVESDSLVQAIRAARAYVRELNSISGFKCCYLDKVKLSRNESR